MSTHGSQSPTPVTLHQPDPVVVTVWPSISGHVLRVLAVLLGILHALTCLVFLWAVYWLNELQENLSKLGTGLGGG